MRQLHGMLLHAVGPGGNPVILNDADTAADLHLRVQALVASIDPNHPFLKVEFEFEGDQGDDGDNEEQPRTSSTKGKGKQVANDEQQGKMTDRIEEFRGPLANTLLAMFSIYGGSSPRESLKRTNPRMSYPSCSGQTGLERLGRHPAERG